MRVLGPVEVRFGGAGRITEFLIQPFLWGFVLLAAIVLILWPEKETEDDEDDQVLSSVASRVNDSQKAESVTAAGVGRENSVTSALVVAAGLSGFAALAKVSRAFAALPVKKRGSDNRGDR